MKTPKANAPADLRPMLRYQFRSTAGLTVEISSRLGEDSARAAAMEHIWGPSGCKIVPGFYRGLGLTLISKNGQPRLGVEDVT